MDTLLMTQASPFRKARSVNATNTSFPSKVPTRTEPTADAATATGQAVIDLVNRQRDEGAAQNSALIVPYGTGDDNDVFEIRVIGWRKIPRGGSTFDLWVPVPLCELTCTMGAIVGVANTPVGSAERFCDTITQNWGSTAGVVIVSPTEDVVASVLVDVRGFTKLEITFDATTGDPTDMNALVALL